MVSGTPIISPFIVYIISILPKLIMATIILAIVFGATLFILYLVAGLLKTGDYDDKVIADRIFSFLHTPNKRVSTSKWLFISFIIFTLLSVLLPNSKAVVGMIVAHHVTYERVEKVGQTVDEVRKEIKTMLNDAINNSQKVKTLEDFSNLSEEDLSKLVKNLSDETKKEMIKLLE